LKKGEGIVQRREVKALLFDLDGVLIDSYEAWFLTYNQTLRHFGFETVTKKYFSKYFGNPVEDDIKRVFIGKTPKEVMDGYALHFPKNAEYVRLFPNVKKVLEYLKNKDIKIGLISNSHIKIVLSVLNHFKIRRFFDAVVTRSDVKRGKPAPDMVLKACKMLGVKPRDAVLVGDTKNDIIAGRRAGCVAVGYGIKGDKKIKNLIEIVKFFP